MKQPIDLLHFEILTEEFGCDPYEDVLPATLQTYQHSLPAVLLAIWENHGLTSHGQGELWFTNPDDFKEIIRAFFGPQREFLVFARTSYGDLYAVLQEQLYLIHPQIARAMHFGEWELLEPMISGTLIREGSQTHREHLRALKKLGPLKADQMYGYVPVLALGGNGSLKETKIVPLREYLLMVADIATSAVREGWNPLGLPTESAP
ncbi:DUF1851 domain-containing protein [Deinococcus sp. Arct2-2]|uniref:GAD-like domain-containing protein n=1 Tax=Deinococcus sp. Arct2-2 TaxID=2568653 RepID=UPI0010A42E3B|nr:GAD-like domain-containing protein [Deinococcus sp. Arct2-2]THF69904.1 DUF1851 domain-containing protein [Deinococcus sp. Arct2-2]THF69912.1 DUF1851 domain-containing protein [Deinococcus sp. Arct2-2]